MRKVISLVTLLLCLTPTASAQQVQKTENHKYVIVPTELVLLAIASQPDCPLQLEHARALMNIDTGKITVDFEFRNRGAKPIVSFGVDKWSMNGGGGTLAIGEAKNQTLLPGQVLKYTEQENQQIVPLTDELRDKLKLRGILKEMYVLVVSWARIADRTSYEAKQTSDALSSYIFLLDNEMWRKEREREK